MPLLVKMYLLFTQYTSDKVRHQFNGPCISQFLEQNCVSSFCKKPQLVKDLDIMIEDLRNKAFPVLHQATQPSMARIQVAHFMDAVLRCILPKPWCFPGPSSYLWASTPRTRYSNLPISGPTVCPLSGLVSRTLQGPRLR